MKKNTCPDCGAVLTCLSCHQSRAGSAKSEAKARAARENAKKSATPLSRRVREIMAERGVSRAMAYRIAKLSS